MAEAAAEDTKGQADTIFERTHDVTLVMQNQACVAMIAKAVTYPRLALGSSSPGSRVVDQPSPLLSLEVRPELQAIIDRTESVPDWFGLGGVAPGNDPSRPRDSTRQSAVYAAIPGDYRRSPGQAGQARKIWNS